MIAEEPGGADDLVPLVPAPRPRPIRKPGPGLLLSFAFWLLLFVVHLAVGIIISIVMAVADAVARRDLGAEAESGDEKVQRWMQDPGYITALFFGSVSATLLLAYVILRIRDGSIMRRTMAFRMPHPIHVGLTILMVVPLFLVASQLATHAIRFLPPLDRSQSMHLVLSQQGWLVIVLIGSVLPALGEELFFRGLLGRGLVARFGLVAGVLITSLLFGLIHLDPPLVLATALIAVFFHVIYYAGRSIWLPILAHALNNVIAFSILRLPEDSWIRATLSLEDEALLPPILFAASLFAVMSLLLLIWSCRTQWVRPDGSVWAPNFATAEIPPPKADATPRLDRPGPWPILAAAGSLIFLAVISSLELAKQ